MQRTVVLLAAVLAAAALPAPGSVAQGDDAQGAATDTDAVTFYGHVFGHTTGAPMPANTEAPLGEENYGIGSFHWCTGTGLPDACQESGTNKLALFSTAGFVDVENRAQWQQGGDYAQLHNERGQTQDILLDTAQPITASIFLSVDYHSWPVGNGYGTLCAYPHPPDVPCLYPYWGWDPGFQPDFVVEATLYTAPLGTHGANASDAPPIDEALEGGDATVVAQGQWGPELALNGVPGAPNVNQFEIDLGPPQVDRIPRTNDFFLVYSFYSDSGGQAWGAHTWRIWSGELFPPTFTLPVKNALSVERVIPQFAHGQLAILGIFNTPWGSYDIDPASIELDIEGPAGAVEPEAISRFADFSVAHGGHYRPINVTWVWDYGRQDLQPGEYTITVSGANFQHSAEASCTATFTLARNDAGGLGGEDVAEGLCGEQTASEELIEELRRGATDG